MEETKKISFVNAPEARSRHVVKYIPMTEELLGTDNDFTFTTPSGEVLHGKLGDVLVKHPDEKIEVWPMTILVSQYELKQPTAVRRLELEQPPVGA